MSNNCEHCGNKLTELHPPIEDWAEHEFCINIFGWKLILLKDTSEYGCTACIVDEENGRLRDAMDEAVYYAICGEIDKGNLVCK